MDDQITPETSLRHGDPARTRRDVLDHGYVQLVDYHGSDEGIIEAARMSTDGGFRGWGPETRLDEKGLPHTLDCASWAIDSRSPEWAGCCDCDPAPGDEKLLRYLWEHKHCYDEATEVLVHGRGFVRWSDVRPGDALGCYDPQTDELVYEVPRELIDQHYRGDMYRVLHGGVDLLVTPGHQMFVKTKVTTAPNQQRWAEEWSLTRAADLGDRAMVRYRKHVRRRSAPHLDLSMFPEHNDPAELLRLIGFFLGDGFASRGGGDRLEFNLRKRRKIEWLREVCAGVGWSMDELSSTIVRAPGVANTFRQLFYSASGEKCVPAFLFDLSAEDAACVLEGLRRSDGSEKRGAWTYCTTSEPLARAVELIALHAGEAVQASKPTNPKSPHHKPLHRLMVLSRMREPVINQGKRNTSREPYDGRVYCAHTRTGVLVVRRNGKTVLSGNSTPFEMAGFTIEVQAPIFVFRQWHRHRTQSYNEMSARYTPLPALDYLPTLEQLMRDGGKNKQAGKAKGADVLNERAADSFREALKGQYERAEDLYQQALADGVPKELARLGLPVARYTRMRASANLRNWLAFLTLRLDPHAQYEIRVYAEAIGGIVSQLYPRTWDLFAEGLDKA